MCGYNGQEIVNQVREIVARQDDLRELVADARNYELGGLVPGRLRAAKDILTRNGDEKGLAVLLQAEAQVKREQNKEATKEGDDADVEWMNEARGKPGWVESSSEYLPSVTSGDQPERSCDQFCDQTRKNAEKTG